MPLRIVPNADARRHRAAEFFAGIGLARLGLENAGFDVIWANDIEPFKRDMYAKNFSDAAGDEFHLGDVGDVSGAQIPDIEIAWASFPCTDLSLAGGRAGLGGSASSTFYHFIRVVGEMKSRAPEVVAVENVHGLATSRSGEDLAAAIRAMNGLGYSVDVLSIDARRFVPQSRPRLFLIGAKNPPPSVWNDTSGLRPDFLQVFFDDRTLRMHKAPLPELPPLMMSGLSSYVEDMEANDPRWWDGDRLSRFVESLSPIQTGRFTAMKAEAKVSYRTAYRRTRAGVAVWEMRRDDISGCLRTARGGSSKQAVVRLGRGEVQVRWMTPREYARLMGAGEYELEGFRDSQVLFGFGDAVCAPAVSWIGVNYLVPLLEGLFDQVEWPTLKAANG